VSNNKISTSCADVHLLFEMADRHVANQKKYYLMFFTKGEPEQPQEQRSSALEVKDYVFGLKRLVPVPL
jgi:hypothetical protein